MLKSVFLHNYTCFVDFEIELSRSLVLVGSNGSGKTSLWEALAGIQDVVVRGTEVANAFPTSSLTRWRMGDPVQRFGVEVQLGAETYRYELEVSHDVGRRLPSIRREQLSVGGRRLYEANESVVCLYGDDPDPDDPGARFPFNRKRSFLPDLEPVGGHQRIVAFREALANLWLLAPSPRLDPTTASEAYVLDRDGHNFASWFRGVLVERPELGSELRAALQPTLPGLQSIAFERISSEVRELMVTFRAQGSDYKVSARELSDGQRVLLLLHGFLLGAIRKGAVAFLDEPETGLAPHEMQPWLSMLSNALEEHDGQALVISHHPDVVDYMASMRTVRFLRPAGGPARLEEITLETTGGTRVSEWLSRPWAYEDEYEEPAP
jgi:hypothetical protein